MQAILLRFSLFGLRVTFNRLAVISYGVLVLLTALLAARLAHLDLVTSLVAGVLSAIIFFLADLAHQLGHAVAARSTGYPMTGIHFFSVLASSIYPDDEPSLSPRLHIRRALGGFGVNVVLGLLTWPLAAYLFPRGAEILPPLIALVGWLAGFATVVNLLIMGLGALVPIPIPGGGWTDGGTLWHYWRELRAEQAGPPG